MTLSFNLVLALFLLAPGFAVYAGVYLGSQLGPIKSPPPPAGSILTLALVTVGALAAHLVGAGLSALQPPLCACLPVCVRVPFEPNAYAVLLDATVNDTRVSAGELLLAMATFAAVTALAFVVSMLFVRWAWRWKWFVRLIYGWLAEVGVADSPDEVILAYVLSEVEEKGTVVGYEGIVENILTTADKEITAITLGSCEMFFLRLTATSVTRVKVAKTTPIPHLQLTKDRIQNIAFERVRFADA